MTPRPKLEVLPPLRRQHDPAALDAFHEDRVRHDLARFAEAPGLLEQYLERARVRFEKTGERAILRQWSEFYQAGERLIAARTEMERKRTEYLQLANEHEIKLAEKQAGLARLDADHEEHLTRAELARIEREFERATLQRRIETITNPPKAELQRESSRDEICAKKLAGIDAQMDRVRADTAEQKKKNPEHAKFLENQLQDKLRQLLEERGKWLY